jgi:hypothetical protein
MRTLLGRLEETAKVLRLKHGLTLRREGYAWVILRGEEQLGKVAFSRWASSSGPQVSGSFTDAQGQQQEMKGWAYFDDVKRWVEQKFGAGHA